MVHLTRGAGQRHRRDGGWGDHWRGCRWWWRWGGCDRRVFAATTQSNHAQYSARNIRQTNACRNRCNRCSRQERHHSARIEQSHLAIERIVALGPNQTFWDVQCFLGQMRCDLNFFASLILQFVNRCVGDRGDAGHKIILQLQCHLIFHQHLKVLLRAQQLLPFEVSACFFVDQFVFIAWLCFHKQRFDDRRRCIRGRAQFGQLNGLNATIGRGGLKLNVVDHADLPLMQCAGECFLDRFGKVLKHRPGASSNVESGRHARLEITQPQAMSGLVRKK